jgi:FAD/FMN-containing dehydrogenase
LAVPSGAEHGIGLAKRDNLIKMMSPAELYLVRSVRRAWDPDRIFNRQKILLAD